MLKSVVKVKSKCVSKYAIHGYAQINQVKAKVSEPLDCKKTEEVFPEAVKDE
jgi:hypothetical protein